MSTPTPAPAPAATPSATPAPEPTPAPAPEPTPGATPAATPAPEPTPAAINPDGTFAEDWHTSLGDEFAPHAATLGRFKNVGDLAKSFIHFRGTGPAFPTDQSGADDIARFHALAKVPGEGTPEAYGLNIPEDASDTDRALYAELSKVAHASHMPQPAMAALVAKYQDMQAEALSAAEAQVAQQKQADQDALVAEWRGDFAANKSTAKHYANNFAREAGLDPDSPELQALNEFPAFNRIMLQVAKNTGEDGVRPPTGTGDLRSPEQQAQAIMDGTDPIHGDNYTNPEASPEKRMAAYNEIARLKKLAAGG